MPGASLIGNLAVTLGLNTAAFERGATKAEVRAKTLQGRLKGIGSSISGLAAGFGVALGTTALVGFAKNAFDVASAMDESAQKMGVTVEQFQRLNLAATQNGVSQETLAGAIAKMNKAIGNLAQGSKPAVDAFAKLGLTFDDLKGKSPDQQLRIIADALNKLPSVQERVAVGAQIMGRGFSELLPLINGGSAGLDHYAEVSKRNGEITTEEAKKLDELSDSWERLKVRTGVAAAKIIAMFAELAGGLDASVNKWYAWRDGIIQAAGQLAEQAVAALGRLADGVRNALVGGLGKSLDWAKSKINEVKEAFRDLYDKVVGHSYVPDMVQEIGYSISELQRIMVDPSLTATQKVGAAFQSLAGVIGSIFGRKTGGILASIGQFVGAIAPLFGGAKINPIDLGKAMPVGLGSPSVRTHVPGFAGGGSGRFGGFGGVDRNLLSLNGSPIMRVSKGEQFTVSNKAQPMAKVLIEPSPYFDAHVDGRAATVAAPMAGRAAVMGAAGGYAAVRSKSARQFP